MRTSHHRWSVGWRAKSGPGLVRLLAIAIVWGAAAGVVIAGSLGTAFTYSGRVKYQGSPANGNFDLQFELWDDLVNGTKHGQTVTVSGLAIANGLFVTSLDFGGGMFDGTAYWLKISIRPSGNGSYTTLSPRQPVNPAPYSLFAPLAGTANSASAAAANSVSGASIQNNAVTSTKIAPGEVVKSLNGLFDDVALAAGANVTLTRNANTLTIASAPGASGWSLAGNAGTTPSANFLGTTDNQPLEIRVNNVRALRLENVGSLLGGFSMNSIGGHTVNSVANGVIGATIAGGGFFNPNLGGDSPNVVGGNFGAIGGGAANAVGGQYGTIAGGFGNQANGVGSFAAGQLARQS